MENKENVSATTNAQKGAKKYSEEEVKRLVDNAVQNAVQEALQKAFATFQTMQQQPQVIIKDHAEDFITLLYMGAVAEGSSVHLSDEMGDILGRGGTRDVPKRVFLQNLNTSILNLLKNRKLLVIEGLTDEERERYGLKYTKEELISPNIYHSLFDMGDDDIIRVFANACKAHKAIIATLFIDAYMNGRQFSTQFIKHLNDLSKSVEPDGMFTAILKDMAKELQEA